MKFRLFSLLIILSVAVASVSCKTNNIINGGGGTQIDSTNSHEVIGNPIYFADPTIFYYDETNTYYLYGTHNVKRGFTVYKSKDLKIWKGFVGVERGFALREDDVYGTHGFWAPQVFKYNGKIYMAYVANEHAAIAKSESPLGPFTQKNKSYLIHGVKTIDPFVFLMRMGVYICTSFVFTMATEFMWLN